MIAILVILAIIALIATPLVTSIIKKAKDSANKRSIDAYGKAAELAVTTYLLDTGEYPREFSSLTIEYNGNEVVCNTQTLNEDGSIYLSGCSVSGTEVKDSKNEDGYYHYGKTTEGPYQAYNVGDMVTYNGMNFYVIENSNSNSDSVTMLKAEPLTVDEVNTYGAGHINIYVEPGFDFYQKAYDLNGYGGMAYYTSETCGYNGSFVDTGCTTDYNDSEVKYAVDAWVNDKLNSEDLKEDSLGYKARLLTLEDLTTNLGYVKEAGVTSMSPSPKDTPSWVYNSNYHYWTMGAMDDSTFSVCNVGSSGSVGDTGISSGDPVVRPVITLLKSAI